MTNLIRRFFSIRYMLKPSQHTDKPLPATKEVYKRQFDLTWPCAVESVLVSLIGSIDIKDLNEFLLSKKAENNV